MIEKISRQLFRDMIIDSHNKKIPIVFVQLEDIESILIHKKINFSKVVSFELCRFDYRRPYTSNNLDIKLKYKGDVSIE